MPKKPLLATAEGLPKLHRRAVLTGALAGSVAAATPASSSLLDRAATSPELSRLIAAERAALAELDAAFDELGALEKKFDRWMERAKLYALDNRMSVFMNARFCDRAEGIAQLERCRASSMVKLEHIFGESRVAEVAAKALREDCDADIAEWEALHDRLDARRAALGIDAAQERHTAALEAWEAARRACMSYPARTPADIEAKGEWLRIAAGDRGDDFSEDDARALLESFVGVHVELS